LLDPEGQKEIPVGKGATAAGGIFALSPSGEKGGRGERRVPDAGKKFGGTMPSIAGLHGVDKNRVSKIKRGGRKKT